MLQNDWLVSLTQSSLRCTLAAVITLAFASTAVVAQEEAGADKNVEADAEEVDPYAVPDGDAEVLLKFIQKMRTERPRARSREEFLAAIRKSHSAILQAADKVLEMKDLEEDSVLQAVVAKFGALSILGQVGDPTAQKTALAFADTLSKDPRKAIQAEAKKQLLMARAAMIAELPESERKSLVEELIGYLKEDVGRQRFSVAMQAANTLERSGNTELAAKAYLAFAATLKDAEDEALQRYAGKLEGSARRITLLGKTMELEGETADGSEFDWASYRGKVVLVDFWASWCGPCIAELPNVKENYENYHDRGFEVVGVNLDNSKEKLDNFVKEREIPWVNLFSSNPETQGWEHPIVTYYGVMGIPTAILVDQEGKVVSLNARGPVLTSKLAELLGPVSDSKPEKDSDTEE